MRMGILTDGKRWLLRWPDAGPVKVVPPYAFTLENPDRWIILYEWLRDHALSAEENIPPSPTRDRGTLRTEQPVISAGYHGSHGASTSSTPLPAQSR